MSFYFSIWMTKWVSSDVGRRTGLSSQLSPNSSILAKRSSTMGLINSSCFRICDGRLDITRATILALIQRCRLMTGGGNIRPERSREHSEDCRVFCDIKRETQIQIQIVLISAYETLIQRQYWSNRSHVHSGAPTNTRFEIAQTTRCIVSTIGTLTQSVFHMNTRNHVSEY